MFLFENEKLLEGGEILLRNPVSFFVGNGEKTERSSLKFHKI